MTIKSFSGLLIKNKPNIIESVHYSDVLIAIKDNKVKIIKDRYGIYEKEGENDDERIINICIQLLTGRYFNISSNVFKIIFERDLEKAIREVLNFHNVRTSKKNLGSLQKK